jgi:hypothetical protein
LLKVFAPPTTFFLPSNICSDLVRRNSCKYTNSQTLIKMHLVVRLPV